MRIALSGASATGKSWAAKELAALLNLTYVPSKAGIVAKEIGFDVNQPFTFEELLYYQVQVLERHLKDIEENPNAVFDRSALDMMAFFLLNLKKSGAKEEDLNLLLGYMQVAIDALEEFETVYIVSPDESLLKGTGEIKDGRLLAEVHGDDYRINFDKVVKDLALEWDTTVIIPADLHYMDRVNFIRKRYDEQ